MKESEKGVVYRSIVAMGMRARQVNDQIRLEIQDRMSDIIIDTSETENTTNYDQIAISKEFDVIPKPTFFAMQEILDDKLHFTIPDLVEEPKTEPPKSFFPIRTDEEQ